MNTQPLLFIIKVLLLFIIKVLLLFIIKVLLWRHQEESQYQK